VAGVLDGALGPRRASAPSSPLELRHASTARPTFVFVPERRFLAIAGGGEPDAVDFESAATLLRAAAIVLRTRAAASHFDYGRTGVLECLWWTRSEPAASAIAAAFIDRRDWYWQLMIEIPEAASDEEAEEAADLARRRGGWSHRLLRIVRTTEGPAAQILHVGDATSQPASLAQLVFDITEAGLEPALPIHVLRVTDEREVGRDRARAIIRVPIREPAQPRH